MSASKTNNKRISERDWFLPAVDEMIKKYTKQEVIDTCDRAGICFAPIARPEDLFEDPQLNQGAGPLLETTFPSGVKTKMPRLPLQIGNHEFIKRSDPPAAIGSRYAGGVDQPWVQCRGNRCTGRKESHHSR